MITDPTTATPIEVDTELARLGDERQKAIRDCAWAVDKLMRELKVERTQSRRALSTWAISAADAISRAEALINAPIEPSETPAVRMYIVAHLQKLLEELAAAQKLLKELAAAIHPLEAEYQRRPWTRAFLAITNGRGHVHKTMWCSTCNRGEQDTAFHWMTSYSGMDETQIVADAGERACTVCYPSAPAEVLNRPTKMFSPDEIEKAKAREVRAADKLKRDRIRIEKALTLDGSEFRVEHFWGKDWRTGLHTKTREYFKTATAAIQWWVEREVRRMGGYAVMDEEERASLKAAMDSIVQALVLKWGQDEAAVRAVLAKKVADKIKRESR